MYQKKHFNNRESQEPRELTEVKSDIRDIRYALKKLMFIDDEKTLSYLVGKKLLLKLKNGHSESGILKEESRFQLILEQDSGTSYLFKSNILKLTPQ